MSPTYLKHRRWHPQSSEQVVKKADLLASIKTSKGLGRMRAQKLLADDEVKAVLSGRCNWRRLRRARLRYPPIKCECWPRRSSRGSCVCEGQRWHGAGSLIACLQLIVRTLIMLDKEEHKSRGAAWPMTGPWTFGEGGTLRGRVRTAKISLHLCLDKEPTASLILLPRPAFTNTASALCGQIKVTWDWHQISQSLCDAGGSQSPSDVPEKTPE